MVNIDGKVSELRVKIQKPIDHCVQLELRTILDHKINILKPSERQRDQGGGGTHL